MGGSSGGGLGLPGMGGSSGGMGGMFGGSGGGGFGDMFSGGMFGGLGNFMAGLGLGGDASKIYGTKPIVPTLADAGQKAITDINLLMPGAEDIAKKVNTFTQQQKNAMMDLVTPGWQKNLGLAGDDINKMMQGVLPESDASAQQLQSVSGAVAGGFGGSGMGRNLVARDLGLRQQELINQGLAANDRWLKTAESLTGPMFDFTKMFPTPQEEFSREWQQNLITAAPDPVARGESDAWNALIGEILSVYSGGAGYKGGYTPQWPNSGGGGGYGGGYYTQQAADMNTTFNFQAPNSYGYDVFGAEGVGGQSYAEMMSASPVY